MRWTCISWSDHGRAARRAAGIVGVAIVLLPGAGHERAATGPVHHGPAAEAWRASAPSHPALNGHWPGVREPPVTRWRDDGPAEHPERMRFLYMPADSTPWPEVTGGLPHPFARLRLVHAEEEEAGSGCRPWTHEGAVLPAFASTQPDPMATPRDSLAEDEAGLPAPHGREPGDGTGCGPDAWRHGIRAAPAEGTPSFARSALARWLRRLEDMQPPLPAYAPAQGTAPCDTAHLCQLLRTIGVALDSLAHGTPDTNTHGP